MSQSNHSTRDQILLVNKYYYPEVGGVETVVRQYAEILSTQFKVVVLCAHKSFHLSTSRESIGQVIVIRCASFGTFLSMPVSLMFFHHFLKERRKSRVVHFHEPFPLASLTAVIPKGSSKYVVTWHSDIVRQRLVGKFVVPVQRRLCLVADAVTTTSPVLRANSRVLRSLRNDTRIIPLSIRIRDYDTSGVRPLEMPVNDRYALYVGRLSYYKGIEILLRAHRLLEGSVPLVVFGRGELASAIKDRMDESDCRNLWFFDRFLTEPEKIYVLRNSAFLVFPSIASSEAFGIVQLEAMACSRPVINTALDTGVPWVSQHGQTGLTVSPGSPAELANAMRRLFENPELASSFGVQARKRVESLFSDIVTSRDVLSLYDQLVR